MKSARNMGSRLMHKKLI